MQPLNERPWMKYYTEENLKEVDLDKCIYDFAFDYNRDYLDDPAIDFYGEVISKRELFDNSRRYGEALYALGANHKGAVVTLMLPTMPETYYAFYGASYIGCSINPIDLRASKETILSYIKSTESEIFVIHEAAGNMDLYNMLLNECGVKHIVVIPTPLWFQKKLAREFSSFFLSIKHATTPFDGDRLISLEQFVEKAEGANFTPNMRLNKPTDNWIIVQSSGTTGSKPKTVKASARNINFVTAEHMNCLMKLKRGDRAMDIMPKWVFFGTMGMHWPISLGMVVCPVIYPTFEKFDELIIRFKPQLVAGSPNHAFQLVNSNKVKDLTCLKTLIVGGDSFPVELEEALDKKLQQIGSINYCTPGYGASENTSICTSSQCDVYKLGAVGIPFMHVGLKVIDEEIFQTENRMVTLPFGQDGIFCMNGNLIDGYDEEHIEEQEKAFCLDDLGERWFVTGDIGYIDEDGFVFFKNRERDIIVTTEGSKITPKPLEDLIMRNPEVRRCALVGKKVPGKVIGEAAICYIELKDKEASVAKKSKVIRQVKSLINKNFGSYTRPDKYVIIDEIPMTPMGKMDRKKLRSAEIKN